MSYEALDEEEKEMFQDVVCFFIGEYEARAKCYWDSLAYCCEIGLDRLKNLCLVKVRKDETLSMHDEDELYTERLSMHDLQRDLGRE